MKTQPKTPAFSLIELLIVIALLVLLMVLAVPAFNSIAQGSGMKRAIGGLGDSIEAARTEAMAKSTWVWLGLADTTIENPGKNAQLTAVIVVSRDGTTNRSLNNLSPLAKPLRVDNVKMLLTRLSKWTTNAQAVKGSDYSFTTTVNGAQKTFTDTVLAFSPQGETILKANQVFPWLEIALQETRGNTPIPDKEASIRVSGVSGQVMVTY